MSGRKLTRRALGLLDAGYTAWGYEPKLQPGTTGMIIYGTGLPKEGVKISREEFEDGVIAVESGPSRSGGYGALNGSVI